MKTYFFSLLILLVCSVSYADAWDDLLAQGHLSKADVGYTAMDLAYFGGTEKQVPAHKFLHADPLRIPFYARTFRGQMLKNVEKPGDLMTSALATVGLAVRRSLGDQDPTAEQWKLAEKKDAVATAIEKFHKLARQPLSAARVRELQKKAAVLPKNLSALTAYLLEVEATAYEKRQRAFKSLIEGRKLPAIFAERVEVPEVDGEDRGIGVSALTRQVLKEVDLGALVAGGTDLIYAVQKFRTRVKEMGLFEKVRFEWTTPLGVVVVTSEGRDDTYAQKPYLLILDLDGNETYLGGGATYDSEHPVSVLIDMKGDDHYLAAKELATQVVGMQPERKAKTVIPSIGAGVMGYGVVADFAGRDTYRAYRHTQGRGDIGMGLLWDTEGNDVYDCWTQCQASGEIGGGLIIDTAGEDKFDGFQLAQGFGGPLGAGVLMNAGKENDVYTANDKQIDFPAIVDKKHNTSLSQGVACGARADYIDGFSLSAGFGALVDEGGDNVFEAGLFAHGTAYWYGVGIISVGEGRDKYHAVKYAGGTSAHFGVGILHDLGGNDVYKVDQELGLAHGHDFGVGFLLDDKGDDEYTALGGFSFGCASVQGRGFFWDRAGNDRYTSNDKRSFGCAALRLETPSVRLMTRTLGFFLDTGGKNSFDSPLDEPKGNVTRKNWTRAALEAPENMTARQRDMIMGFGRVADAPDTVDPL